MKFVATVTAGPDVIATYHGELGHVRRKAHKKLRQLIGRAFRMGALAVTDMSHDNWGDSFIADGLLASVHCASTIRTRIAHNNATQRPSGEQVTL